MDCKADNDCGNAICGNVTSHQESNFPKAKDDNSRIEQAPFQKETQENDYENAISGNVTSHQAPCFPEAKDDCSRTEKASSPEVEKENHYEFPISGNVTSHRAPCFPKGKDDNSGIEQASSPKVNQAPAGGIQHDINCDEENIYEILTHANTTTIPSSSLSNSQEYNQKKGLQPSWCHDKSQEESSTHHSKRYKNKKTCAIVLGFVMLLTTLMIVIIHYEVNVKKQPAIVYQATEEVCNKKIRMKEKMFRDGDITTFPSHNAGYLSNTANLDYNFDDSSFKSFYGWNNIQPVTESQPKTELQDGYWIAANPYNSKYEKQWIQIDLKGRTTVVAIVTYGHAGSFSGIGRFKISHGYSIYQLQVLRDNNGNDVIFQATPNHDVSTRNDFPRQVSARYIKLINEEPYLSIAVKMEYVTC